ncbi:MAG: SDR family NAD(P)-dependent oxidoreductase, partial [Actinomycetota bacterium]
MDLGLEGSVVVITGGTEGLGLALARRLVVEGASVAICSRRSDAVTAATEELLGLSSSGEVLGLVVDVTSPDAIEAFARATLERFGRVDGLVNNAGQSAAQGILEVDDAA